MNVTETPQGFHLGSIKNGSISGALLGIPEQDGSLSMGLYFSRFARSKSAGWVWAGKLWPQHVPNVRAIISEALSLSPERTQELIAQRGEPNWFLTPSNSALREGAVMVERGPVSIAIEAREKPFFGRRFSWRPLQRISSGSFVTWFAFSQLPELLDALDEAAEVMEGASVPVAGCYGRLTRWKGGGDVVYMALL